MRLYLYKNILYKLFRRDSAPILLHLSIVNLLLLYLITNIGDAPMYRGVSRVRRTPLRLYKYTEF
jgi:hypothetical protein